jgi:hypothetical protein
MNEKTFFNDFYKLKYYLQNNIHFSFTRFSDGELFVLQNKRLELNENHYIIGDSVGGGWYNKEEQKKFIPGEHEYFRQKLEDCLKCDLPMFYRGICTKPDVDVNTFNWMINLAGGDSETLTWSNLLINGNYEKYLNEIVPLFNDKEIIMIVNESANLNKLPFKVKKDFRVGTNCFINDYHLIEIIKKYIIDNNIKNHLFLVSAASLSNLLIHQLHILSKENTYFEIGSTLNPIMEMDGWKGSRGYLREYWLGQHRNYLNMICLWN